MSVRQGPLGLQSSRTSEATIHSRSPPPVAPVFTGGFFDRTPEAARARAAYFKVLAGGLGLLTITIFAVLSIYWGALWRTDRFIRNLNGWIVDFDGGDIGAAVVQNFLGVNGEPMKISWEIRPASDFPNGVDDLAQAVISERCWVALSINQNATARLNAAVASLDANYDGTSAVTAFGVEARNEDAYRVLLKPNIDIPMDQLSVNFANQFARTLISRQIDISALLSTAPQIITRPAYFTIRNLRPFDVPVASAVTFVGLIYLLIISFIAAGIANGARLAAGFEQRLSLPSLISTRIVTSISMYFILSLFYSLQSLAFQLPFNRRFGHPGFLVFWMLMWFGMTALGLAVEAMFTLLTPRFIPFFLVLWIISNVSTCFYPLETLPAFYRYGYASPFYNVSRGIRTIVFSTRNMLGLNFGVLIAWIAISCITIPLTSWLVRSRQIAALRSQKQQ
ncbi:MNNG export permease-like protein [Pleurotus pulmonarius]